MKALSETIKTLKKDLVRFTHAIVERRYLELATDQLTRGERTSPSRLFSAIEDLQENLEVLDRRQDEIDSVTMRRIESCLKDLQDEIGKSLSAIPPTSDDAIDGFTQMMRRADKTITYLADTFDGLLRKLSGSRGRTVNAFVVGLPCLMSSFGITSKIRGLMGKSAEKKDAKRKKKKRRPQEGQTDDRG